MRAAGPAPRRAPASFTIFATRARDAVIEVNWTEQEYLDYLESERHMYAWCLVAYAGLLPSDAREAAQSFYPYEPAGKHLRGLVFHDHAWHWAMLRIVGESYWVKRPDLLEWSAEYRAESDAYDARSAARAR